MRVFASWREDGFGQATPWEGNSWRAIYPSEYRPAVALAEARAIMAETEPIPDGCACVDCMVLAPFNAPLGLLPEEREILADALRAFVGEECRCVQGLHWSAERGYYHCAGVMPEGE